MKSFKTILLFSTVILFLLLACNENPGPTSSNNSVKGTFAITNGFLIDGSGSNPVPNSIVIIQDGLIQSVGRNPSLDIPSGVEIIDLQGSYILPGLMNTHVHSGYAGNKECEIQTTSIPTRCTLNRDYAQAHRTSRG